MEFWIEKYFPFSGHICVVQCFPLIRQRVIELAGWEIIDWEQSSSKAKHLMISKNHSFSDTCQTPEHWKIIFLENFILIPSKPYLLHSLLFLEWQVREIKVRDIQVLGSGKFTPCCACSSWMKYNRQETRHGRGSKDWVPKATFKSKFKKPYQVNALNTFIAATLYYFQREGLERVSEEKSVGQISTYLHAWHLHGVSLRTLIWPVGFTAFMAAKNLPSWWCLGTGDGVPGDMWQ